MAERYGFTLITALPFAPVNALSLTFYVSYISLH